MIISSQILDELNKHSVRNKILEKNLIRSIVMIGFASLVFFSVAQPVMAQAYAEPSSPPPAGILPSRDTLFEYLLGSSAIQQKVGSLILGQKIRRIAVYTCDVAKENIWLSLVQNDAYLHQISSYYNENSTIQCEDDGDVGPQLTQLFADHAANPFQLIIMQEPHISDPTHKQQLLDAVANGATLFGSGEVYNIAGPARIPFIGTIMCQSQCDDVPGSGCAFLGQTNGGGSCTAQGGTANSFDHGFFKLTAGDALQKPVENRFEGILADSVERTGTINPTIDIPYSNPGTQGAIGEVAHWKYGKGQVYFVADESRDGYPAESTCSSDVSCINGSLGATQDFYIQTWRNIIDACNGDCASLCLNAAVGISSINNNTWLNDPTNCIRSWTELQTKLTINSAHLWTSGQVLAGQVDRGFAVLKSNDSLNQKISLIAETPAGGPGAFQAVSTTTSQYAGYLNGPVTIQKNDDLADFCLNGTCITDWSQAVPVGFFPDFGINLQSSHMAARRAANLRLQGPLIGESIILGVPSNFTPISVTCGDRICSFQNNENSTSCPVDC